MIPGGFRPLRRDGSVPPERLGLEGLEGWWSGVAMTDQARKLKNCGFRGFTRFF